MICHFTAARFRSIPVWENPYRFPMQVCIPLTASQAGGMLMTNRRGWRHRIDHQRPVASWLSLLRVRAQCYKYK